MASTYDSHPLSTQSCVAARRARSEHMQVVLLRVPHAEIGTCSRMQVSCHGQFVSFNGFFAGGPPTYATLGYSTGIL